MLRYALSLSENAVFRVLLWLLFARIAVKYYIFDSKYYSTAAIKNAVWSSFVNNIRF